MTEKYLMAVTRTYNQATNKGRETYAIDFYLRKANENTRKHYTEIPTKELSRIVDDNISLINTDASLYGEFNVDEDFALDVDEEFGSTYIERKKKPEHYVFLEKNPVKEKSKIAKEIENSCKKYGIGKRATNILIKLVEKSNHRNLNSKK